MSTGGTLTTLEFSRLVKRIMQERELNGDQNGLDSEQDTIRPRELGTD